MVEKKSLTQDELQIKIKELVPDWKAGENDRGVPYIERVKHASTYMEGIDFVTKVAVAAEANNHHPDIHISKKRTLSEVRMVKGGHSATASAGK